MSEPAIVLCVIFFISLSWTGFVSFRFLEHCKGEAKRMREAMEQALIISNSKHGSEAVDALSTLEHNKEALRQAQSTFDKEFSTYKPKAKKNESAPKPKSQIVKDQNGHTFELHEEL